MMKHFDRVFWTCSHFVFVVTLKDQTTLHHHLYLSLRYPSQGCFIWQECKSADETTSANQITITIQDTTDSLFSVFFSQILLPLTSMPLRSSATDFLMFLAPCWIHKVKVNAVNVSRGIKVVIVLLNLLIISFYKTNNENLLYSTQFSVNTMCITNTLAYESVLILSQTWRSMKQWSAPRASRALEASLVGATCAVSLASFLRGLVTWAII